jgi:hypothetical protein
MSRLVYLAPCAVVLAACGGGPSSSVTEPSPVSAAADKTRRAGSEQMAVNATVTLGGGRSLRLQGRGAFDQRTGTGDLHSTLTSANNQATTLDEIFSGDRMWLQSPLFGNVFTPGKSWLEIDDSSARKLGFDFKGLTGQSPADVLTQLDRTSSSVRTLGTERVGGVETTHYRASIDPAKVPTHDPVQTLTGAKYEPLDVWVDGRGMLRKVQLVYTAKTDPTKPGRAHVVLDMSFSDYGARVDATPPPADETVDASNSGKLGG